MLVVTTENISGKQLEMLGVVKGSTVQSKNAFRDIGSSFKSIVGGELVSYNEMMSEARRISTERMIEEASNMGADAIVCLRYASASIMDGAAEVMAYGTAVKYK